MPPTKKMRFSTKQKKCKYTKNSCNVLVNVESVSKRCVNVVWEFDETQNCKHFILILTALRSSIWFEKRATN